MRLFIFYNNIFFLIFNSQVKFSTSRGQPPSLTHNFVIFCLVFLCNTYFPINKAYIAYTILFYNIIRIYRCSQEMEAKAYSRRSRDVAEAKQRRSRGTISPASILSESRNYPNCVHLHIFYFM